MALLKKMEEKRKLAKAEKTKKKIEEYISELEIDIKICESDIASLKQQIKETLNQQNLKKCAFELRNRESDLLSLEASYIKEQEKLSIVTEQINALQSHSSSANLNVEEISKDVQEKIQDGIAEQEIISQSREKIEIARQHEKNTLSQYDPTASIIQKVKNIDEPTESTSEKTADETDIDWTSTVEEKNTQHRTQRKQFE